MRGLPAPTGARARLPTARGPRARRARCQIWRTKTRYMVTVWPRRRRTRPRLRAIRPAGQGHRVTATGTRSSWTPCSPTMSWRRTRPTQTRAQAAEALTGLTRRHRNPHPGGKTARPSPPRRCRRRPSRHKPPARTRPRRAPTPLRLPHRRYRPSLWLVRPRRSTHQVTPLHRAALPQRRRAPSRAA